LVARRLVGRILEAQPESHRIARAHSLDSLPIQDNSQDTEKVSQQRFPVALSRPGC